MFASRNFLFAKSSVAAVANKLFSWGQGTSGKLGLGNTTSYSSPKQIGAIEGLSIASVISYRTGVISVGKLLTFGAGSYGVLGLGNTTSYSSPKQVGSLTNWSSIKNGYEYFLAAKTDGTLWSWGAGSYGQLGQGNTTTFSSPKHHMNQRRMLEVYLH